jgi:GR25 family glycosyltransferase involved in LPS biosynthesis
MKCRIIRLKNNELSCNIAKDSYDQAVKFGVTPEYFDAINGSFADDHYDITGLKKFGKFKKNRPGVLGCFFSHYYLWLETLKTNTPTIILEHDGYFIRHVDKNILDEFDDVLKLDKLDPFSKNYSSMIENENDQPILVENYVNPSMKKISKIGDSNYFRGAYSYILKPSGAGKLISFVKNNGHLPADQQISESILNLKTTSVTVARLHPFYAIGNNIKEQSLTRKEN